MIWSAGWPMSPCRRGESPGLGLWWLADAAPHGSHRRGAALLMAIAGLAAVLGVQTRANSRLTAKNDQLDASVRREAERFKLAMDAIKLFHGEVSEDLLLKEKRFEGSAPSSCPGRPIFMESWKGCLKTKETRLLARHLAAR